MIVLRNRFVDGVDEHRAADGDRVVVLVLGHVHLRVRDRPQHVGDGLRQRSERCQRPFARLGLARERHEGQHHELALHGLRYERRRGCGHHVRDRRELIGSAVRLGDESGDHIGGRGQHQHAAHHGPDRMQAQLEPGHDTEVAPTSADRPEQIGLVVGVDLPDPAVGGDHLGREQIVDRHAVLA